MHTLLANTGHNCDECEERVSGVSCLTCPIHAYLDLCQPCDDSRCLTCNSAADECEQCLTGYYKTDTNECASELDIS